MAIGVRLKELRRAAGITRPALARATAGVSEGYITHIERGDIGDPKTSTLIRIVRGLASITGQPPMQVLEYLLQDALQNADTNAPAGGGR